MSDIRFESLTYLHLLWVVVLLFGVVLFGMGRKRRALERFASAGLLPQLASGVSRRRQWLRGGLVLASLVALVLGLVDPRWGRFYQDIPRRGIDVIFVLDVSRSMLAEDIAPNRLGRAKQYIGDVLEAMAGDRVGLVTFAGEPMLKVPLTVNYGAMRMALDEVSVRSAPRGGTLIGDAIRRAADSFTDEVKDHKAIVVLTDGDDQESYPVEAAGKAFKEKGIRVYTVGLGSDTDGARVPDKSGKPGIYAKHEGREVWSKMSPQTLSEIALAGEGAYIPAGTADIDLGAVLYEDRIAKAEKREFESRRLEQYRVRYPWFAGLALAALALEMLISDRRPVRGNAVS